MYAENMIQQKIPQIAPAHCTAFWAVRRDAVVLGKPLFSLRISKIYVAFLVALYSIGLIYERNRKSTQVALYANGLIFATFLYHIVKSELLYCNSNTFLTTLISITYECDIKDIVFLVSDNDKLHIYCISTFRSYYFFLFFFS